MAVEAPPKVAELIAGEMQPSGARRRDTARSWVLGVWSALALIYLFIPIVVIVVFSFNDNKGRFNFTWQGFTLDHWAHPFSNPDLATAMKNSLMIALITTIIATALGTFMAIALVRYGFRGRSVVDFFVFLPLSTPEVVIGAALLGTPRQFMIGNVIQSKFLVTQDYPGAAALSFILMAFILIAIFVYARGLGAKNLSEAAI